MNKLTASVFAILMTLSTLALASMNADAILVHAEQGDANAQLLAGDLYAFGEKGVTQDYRTALDWYEKSANQGNPVAQYNMAVILMVGVDFIDYEKSKTKSVELFTKAANNKVALAKYNLGVAHARGDGVKQDKDKAVQWFKKACESGVQEGCDSYDSLTK